MVNTIELTRALMNIPSTSVMRKRWFSGCASTSNTWLNVELQAVWRIMNNVIATLNDTPRVWFQRIWKQCRVYWADGG